MGTTLVVDTLGFNGYAELDARGQPTSPRLHTVERLHAVRRRRQHRHRDDHRRSRVLHAALRHQRSRGRRVRRVIPFEYDCMENPRQEDFENAYYVRERYRPICMRVEGEGMLPSKMVCGRPE